MTELYNLSISEAARLISTRQLSPVELTRAFLARIEALNDRLHAFLLVTPEKAVAAAQQAEMEITRGDYRGPLHGIPVGVKDVFDTAGIPTTGQSRLLQDRIPARDAAVVRRLYEAGAILLGKLATKECAGGGPSFDLYYPPARNPWNLGHVTGDSSTGPGAGVAAGLCMGALGSDTSGSIREPAAFCGLVGLKPTYGRVSRGGMIPQSPSLDHAGPMTRTVRDNALMLQAIAGYDAEDPASAAVAVPDFSARLDAGVKGCRIGVVRHFYDRDERAEPEVIAALESAYGTLGELGATLVEVELPPLAEFIACCQIIMLAEAFTIHERDLHRTPDLYGEGLRGLLLMGAFISAADYLQAVRRRRELCQEVEELMAAVDVLVTAAEFRAAPRIVKTRKLEDAIGADPLMPFSVTGLPALAVCCGFNGDGLPLSMQIIGKPFEEATVLGVGNAYERATPWRELRPLSDD
jgi:aspartyl-tRNA(Asn)/glutamyl-tRNA(Gln) amidotransferase subunit A